MKSLSIKSVRRYAVPALTLLVFGILIAITVSYLLYESRMITDRIIVKDIERLQKTFEKIDKHCMIMEFDSQKNPVDFLTVEKFVGSEIGSMNLMHPEHWEGPYIEDNPTVQGKVYEIVRTDQGHFIVPGTGVRLNNGRIIGEDIILDERADIEDMMRDPDMLQFEGKPMAAKIPVGGVSAGYVMDALVPKGR